MKHCLSIFIVIISICSCKSSQVASQNRIESDTTELNEIDSLNITIESINLSEDMSRLSTNDDEILVLIYEYMDSSELEKPLLNKQFKFDQNNRIKKVAFKFNKYLITKKLLFIMIEQDSETPTEQIDPIIRIQHKQIIDAYISKDYLEIEKYIGDEDLLGVKIIEDWTNSNKVEFKFDGIYKLDKYEYLIKIK